MKRVRAEYPYDDYFVYGGGLGGDRNAEVFRQMRDIRRHGQDVTLTLTVDCSLGDEHLIAIAKDLVTFGRMRIRINHECAGRWFTHNKRFSYKEIGDFFVRFHKIIKEYADLDDYHKLLAYNNKLCSLTDPDDNTTGGKNTVYGDPWQVVRIFNGDNSAKCASDGYAKAFRYLCDNSVFKSGSVYCLSLTGKYISNDYHLWGKSIK